MANRSPDQIAMVIGPGTVRFEARFLRMTDQNLKQNRFDFVALRADGAAVRFHPKGDTVPVIMDLKDWAMGNAPIQGEAWYREAVPDADPAASRDSQVGRRTKNLWTARLAACCATVVDVSCVSR